MKLETPRGGVKKEWWTRSERIRTAAQVAMTFAFTDEARPRYQEIAAEVDRLHRLGLSLIQIARHLNIDDKTAAKALRWIGDGRERP